MGQAASNAGSLSPAFYRLLTDAVHKRTGVVLDEKNRRMVEARLLTRAHDLGLSNLGEYMLHFDQYRDVELEAMVGLLTTHHTYFFRESVHFEYLINEGLARLAVDIKKRPDKKLRVWCAASSRGHEAYTLAMLFEEHISAHGIEDFEIIGTDIDPESTRIATEGVYRSDELRRVPLKYQLGRWAKGTGEIAKFVRVAKRLQSKVSFFAANLLHTGEYPAGRFDLIFCRNVFIYFDIDRVHSIAKELIDRLEPSGLLILGLSETLAQSKLNFENLGPSIYARKGTAVQPQVTPKTEPTIKTSIRVLCVDDSPTILNLLQKILTRDRGFEIVGTAKNGKEAMAIASSKEFDVMTLDIHMPEMTGIDYLRNVPNKKTHPPVVMVSSVNRNDLSLAGQAFSLGARDYVEKPEFSKLFELGAELEMKLKAAVMDRHQERPSELIKHERQIFRTQDTTKDPNTLGVIISFSLSRRKHIAALVAEFNSELKLSPKLLADTSDDLIETVRSEISSSALTSANSIQTAIEEIRAAGKKPVILHLGIPSPKLTNFLQSQSGVDLFLEDALQHTMKHPLTRVAKDVGPISSFVYFVKRMLA